MKDLNPVGRPTKRLLRPNSGQNLPTNDNPVPVPVNPEMGQEKNAINELLNFQDEEDNEYHELVGNPYSNLYHPTQNFHTTNPSQLAHNRKFSEKPLDSKKWTKRKSEKDMRRNSFENVDCITGIAKVNEWEKLLGTETSKYFTHDENLAGHFHRTGYKVGTKRDS